MLGPKNLPYISRLRSAIVPPPCPNPDIFKSGDDRAEIMNPWEKSLALLSDEDKKQFKTSSDAAPMSISMF